MREINYPSKGIENENKGQVKFKIHKIIFIDTKSYAWKTF